MGKYIDRIIEVLDDNNVWKAVVLPRNEMGENEESIVFGYPSDRNYDMDLDGTLVKSATEISEKNWPMPPEAMCQHRSIKDQSIAYR